MQYITIRCLASSTRSAPLRAINPAVFSYEKKLVAAARTHDWSTCLRLLRDLGASGLSPSDGCQSAALSAFSRAKLWVQAISLFQQFCDQNDSFVGRSTFNATLGAYAKGARWPEAISILERMRSNEGGAPSPDAVTFSVVVDACANATCWEAALALLLDAAAQQFGPNASALGAAVSAQEKGTQWLRAIALLTWAQELGLSITAETCNAAVSACGRGGAWEHAMAILAKMQFTGPAPTTITYNAAISACGLSEQWSLALFLLEDMSAHKLRSTTISHTGVIDALTRAIYWEAALDAFTHLQHAGLAADRIYYNVTMSACAQGLQWAASLFLLREAAQKRLHSMATSYNTAMASLQSGARWDIAFALLEEMRDCRIDADDVTARLAVTAAIEGGALEAAIRCCREMVDVGLLSLAHDSELRAIDFHGMTVPVACVALACSLLDWAITPPSQVPCLQLKGRAAGDALLVVGRGLGAVEGKGVIASGLLEFLEDLDLAIALSVDPTNQGRLWLPASEMTRWYDAWSVSTEAPKRSCLRSDEAMGNLVMDQGRAQHQAYL